MAIASGILLASYIIAIVLVINWPTRRRHPEDGQAVGCLLLVALGCAGVGVVLAAAVYFHLRWLVYIIFAITAYPALYTLPQFAWRGYKNLKTKRAAKGRRITHEEMTTRLAGFTYVIHRDYLDPKREYDDLKYYHPDGRLTCYEQEGDSIKRLPVAAEWKVTRGLLKTRNEHHPGNKNAYTLWETPEGQIAYYIHAPFSRVNRRLSGSTIAVREGEPVETPLQSLAPPQRAP